MAEKILVPSLGESVSEAIVARWFKNVGDAVAADEPLVELETDKVTLEVNAPAAGTLAEITVQSGSKVAVGSVLGVIGAGAAKAAVKPAANQDQPKAAAPAPAAPVATTATAAPLSPAVRRMTEEHNITPSSVPATGKGGRVTKADVVNYMESAPVKAPASSGPREERVRMTTLRRRIAQRLKESQNTAAILTTFNEVDMSAVMALRNEYKDEFEKKYGIRLGFMSFFVKAAVAALKNIPEVNAQIDGDDIVYKNYYDVGVAVGTEQGLVVPVVRDADRLNFAEIEGEIGRLAKKARDGKLSMEELTGGTFTITNGGVYGSLLATPIINPPQSGILGLHKVMERPVAINGKVEIRPMMYIALSYDHRIIDGRESVTFLKTVKEYVEDPRRLLLGF